MLKVKCKDHPRYEAKSPAINKCKGCMHLWSLVSNSLIERVDS